MATYTKYKPRKKPSEAPPEVVAVGVLSVGCATALCTVCGLWFCSSASCSCGWNSLIPCATSARIGRGLVARRPPAPPCPKCQGQSVIFSGTLAANRELHSSSQEEVSDTE